MRKNRRFQGNCVAAGLLLVAASLAFAGCASNALAPPVITSLNPSRATAGGPAFTLRVIGTGFLSTDVVLWNGAALATQPVSGTELDAQVPATLIQSAVIVARAQRRASGLQAHTQVTPAQSTADATANVNVSRKPPGSVESNTMTFTITPSGPTQDFSISASPSSQTVTAGQGTTYSVAVGALNGFTGTVNLSLTGPSPQGVTFGFSPASIAGSGMSTLTFMTSVGGVNTPPGTYMFNVIGTSGSLVHSVPVTLIVNAAATPGLTVNVAGPGNIPGNSNANLVVKFGNSGSTALNGVSVAIIGVPNTVSVASINLDGAPGNCTITNLTCTLTGTLAAGSDPVVVLTFQAAPGSATFTLTATVSATGTASASGSTTVTVLNCVPQPGVLCGQYALFVQGYTSAGPKAIAASFTADGAGHITAGIFDLNSMSAPATGIPILTASPTGYSFDANRLGNLTLNTSAGTFVFKFALDPTGTFGSVIEYEPSGASSGSGFLQLLAPAFHEALITGNYGLATIGGLGGASSGIRLGMLGAISANGACSFGATGATGTINNGGTLSRSINFSGMLNPSGACKVDATTGRGTGTFSSLTGTPAPSFSSLNFTFYVIDTNADGTVNHMVIVSTDQTSSTQPLLSGVVGNQHNGPYSTNAALDCARGTNLGCVFAFAGATGGNSLSGNSYVLAGLASITTQSNTAGALSLLRDENNGGTVASGTITASYRYNSDGTGSYTPSTGEVIDFILTDIDVGFTLSEGSNVSYGFFAAASSPFGPFNPVGLASKTFFAGTRSLGTASATTTVALTTVTQVPTGSNTGTFSGNIGFWNSTTHQNSGVLTGTYTTDTLTFRVTGTTNILGAASFAVYQLSTNQFVLVGTTASDTGAVLIVF